MTFIQWLFSLTVYPIGPRIKRKRPARPQWIETDWYKQPVEQRRKR